MEEGMTWSLALSTGGGGCRGVGERACRPCGAASLTRMGARGAAVSERRRREVDAGAREAGPASLAGPVGGRRPASEQPPLPFF